MFTKKFALSMLVILVGMILHGCAAAQSLTLTWTAPGDPKPNGSLARCVAYRIALDTTAIDSANCLPKNLLAVPLIPKMPGQPETLQVIDLRSETWYWLLVEARDSAGNWAACSNIVQKRTPDLALPKKIADLLVK